MDATGKHALATHLQALQQDVMRQCPDVNPQVGEEFFTQLDADYFTLFTPDQIATHLTLLATVTQEHPVQVRIVTQSPNRAEILLAAYDLFGEFSLITGLMAAFGLDIRDGQVFSYHRGSGHTTPWGHTDGGLIIDVFTTEFTPDHAFDQAAQANFITQLTALIQLLRQGHLQQARDTLNYRLIDAVRTSSRTLSPSLLPVDISIDNESSADWTVVHITAEDTPGFLYSLSNALAMRNIYIHRVSIRSHAGQVQDRLDLGWRRGGKILSPEGQRELRLIVSLIKQFTHFLTSAPDPVKALRHFDHLMDRLAHDGSVNDTFPWLWEADHLKALATVLGSSDFLWEDFLRLQYATLLPVLKETTTTAQHLDKQELTSRLQHALQTASSTTERKERLNAFKDRELFRIDMRHVLYPELPFGLFSEELTELAEVVLSGALTLAQQILQPTYGTPLLTDASPCAFALLGLGKFGGHELGYASDIEMMCAYSGRGNTSGSERIAISEYAEKLVQQIRDCIRARRSGIFEIDLRLRPFGSHGPLATSLEAFQDYYHAEGQAAPFERQALIKLRWVAGDATLGRHIEALRDRFVYSPEPFDVGAAVRLRQRQIDELVKPGTVDTKYGRGGLIDIEYTVQYLQLLHGSHTAELHTPNTLEAMHALHAAGYLTPSDYQALQTAYVFLRYLIDALRMVRGHARDLVLPPPAAEEFTFLARRMGYWNDQGTPAQLAQDIEHHMQQTARIYQQRFGEG